MIFSTRELVLATLLVGVAPTVHGEVIGQWTFNEGGGATALDATTNGNHGAISGGVYVTTPGGTGISLDGVDDSVSFGSPALFNFTTESFSIAAWVAINTGVAQANNEWIFGKLDSSYRLGYKEDGGAKRITRSLFSNDSGESPGGEMNPAFSFHHIVLTKSTSDSSRVYIDGVDEPLFNGGGYAPIADNAGVDLVAGQGGGNNLECIIDELVVYDEQLSAAAVSDLFLAGPTVTGTVTRRNNLVNEMVNLDAAGIGVATDFDFTHSRDGWIFVSSSVAGTLSGADGAALSLPGPPVDILMTHTSGTPHTLEAMRWLSSGDYTLELQTTGSATLGALVVRAIPELILWRLPAGAPLPQQRPVFDWETLKELILPSMNTIVASRAIVEAPLLSEYQPIFDEWRAEGKRWFVTGLVPAYQFGPTMTVQQAYDFWANNAAYSDPQWDGIIIDEFGVGDYPSSQYTEMEAAQRLLAANFPDKFFYPLVIHTEMNMGEPASFLRAVNESGSPFVWEWYEREEPDVASANAKLASTLSQGMVSWGVITTNDPSRMMVCLGYFYAPPNSLNENPAVDFKVWMDMQFNRIATDSRFDGLAGLIEYNSKFTDEEVFRWQAALYRHYGIEGNTSMLSDAYGYQYVLTHLTNPDFDQGTAGWTLNPAAAGSISSGTFTGLGRLEGRVRGSTRGDNFLLMTRSAAAPNRAVQQITGLVPGKIYSMKMFTADHQDYVNTLSVMEEHAVHIKIDGVVMIDSRGFQEVMQSERGQEVPPFSSMNQPWFNYYWRLFVAQDTTATLTISDWATDSDPGGPIGEELMYNFIEVQPYFAEESAFAPVNLDGVHFGSAAALSFTSEAGTVNRLMSADTVDGTYTSAGAEMTGTGGIQYLFDPKYPVGISTGKFYRVMVGP